ncbi:amidohydrolase family protein [Sulfitobacter sp. HNIBRBA2951]|uniref:amidohydrolase family protein n=1 Tax=Sulfitobacter aquimarinus TaxID=3158557 RepID=UPI0032DF9B1E
MQDIAIPRSLLRRADAFGGQRIGDCQRGAPVIADHRIVGLETAVVTAHPQVVIPAPTDPHCHLDKCHTIGRLGPVAGDLAAAIAAQSRDKARWTDDDIRTRATRGLSEARSAGVGALRSHVDWGTNPTPPRAWHVLREIAEQSTDITLQLCPLIGVELMADPDWAKPVGQAAAQSGGALGAFVQGHGNMQQGIEQIFALAAQYGLPLDFHVDEGLGDLNGLEVIADMALATGFDGPVLCGHAVSLMDRDTEAFARIADKLARAGIAVCALPTTNLYLQDRRRGTPDRRGITRLRELRAAGVTVLTGSDNVADAFCPLGQFDPLAALHLCALTAHLDPPMAQWLPMITTDARTAMGLPALYIEDTPLSLLRISDATDCESLVAGRSPLRPLKPIAQHSLKAPY